MYGQHKSRIEMCSLPHRQVISQRNNRSITAMSIANHQVYKANASFEEAASLMHPQNMLPFGGALALSPLIFRIPVRAFLDAPCSSRLPGSCFPA